MTFGGCLSIDRPVDLSLNPCTAHFPQSFLERLRYSDLPWTDFTCINHMSRGSCPKNTYSRGARHCTRYHILTWKLNNMDPGNAEANLSWLYSIKKYLFVHVALLIQLEGVNTALEWTVTQVDKSLPSCLRLYIPAPELVVIIVMQRYTSTVPPSWVALGCRSGRYVTSYVTI